MANVEYIVNANLHIPRIIMKLESENGDKNKYIEIENIELYYDILSKSVLQEYLLCLENKMIEYLSEIVYANSSADIVSKIYVIANIRDNLRVYLYPPKQQ